MIACLRFEVYKFLRRPSTWILALILVVAVAFLDYYQLYNAYETTVNGGKSFVGNLSGRGLRDFRDYMLPKEATLNIPSFLAALAAPFVLILGALSVGSEYGWDTVKTSLTQGVGRTGLLAGRVLAVAVVTLAFVVVSFAAGLVSSYVVAGALGVRAVAWPEASMLLKSMGVTWLIFGAWASLGMFLAFLFRGTALSIGLGLIYGIVFQTLISSLSANSELFQRILDALLSKNSSDLVSSLGSAPKAFSGGQSTGDPTQAALILSAYVVACLLLSALLFGRRDVT